MYLLEDGKCGFEVGLAGITYVGTRLFFGELASGDGGVKAQIWPVLLGLLLA